MKFVKPRFSITRELKTRATTQDEALAPLRAALPWDKRFAGAIATPVSKLKYTCGNKGHIDLFIDVVSDSGGYILKVSATWLHWIQCILIPGAAVLALSCFRMEIGLFFGAMWLLFIPLWVLNGRRHADQAIKDLTFAYNTGSTKIKVS